MSSSWDEQETQIMGEKEERGRRGIKPQEEKCQEIEEEKGNPFLFAVSLG